MARESASGAQRVRTPPRPADPNPQPDDEAGAREPNIRPQRLCEFVGQRGVVKNLEVYVAAARARGEALDHILLSGMPGLGKTTLAHLVADEMGAGFRATSGPVLDKAKDLVGILTQLGDGDVLFIDEVHRLNHVVEEYLYSAMEDYSIDIVIDQGPNARSLKLHLKRFTLVAATTREGDLSAPFRARFGIQEKLEPYPVDEMVKILERSARILNVPIDVAGARVLAERSRGTPRIANRYLRRLRDFAEVDGVQVIDCDLAASALERLGVDRHGLDTLDRRILSIIADGGGTPVGVKTIAVSVGEEERTIEDVYEPHLIRGGYLVKTPRGRLLGPFAGQAIDLARNARRRLDAGELNFGEEERA
ncbi:MAG: Holliday junction branch migration DNA helicase RuvB [Planctomycetota bacterium]